MPKGKMKYLPIPAFLMDVLLLFNAYFTAAYLIFDGAFPNKELYVLLFFGSVAVWGFLTIYLKMYDMPRVIYLDKLVAKDFKALVLFVVLGAAFLFVIKGYGISRVFYFSYMALFAVAHICWHTMLSIMLKSYRRGGKNYRTVAILGFNAKVEQLIQKVLLPPENGYKIKSIFSDEAPSKEFLAYHKGNDEALFSYLETEEIDELFISLPTTKSYLLNKYVAYADNNLMRVHIMPNFSGYLFQKFYISYINNIATLRLRDEPLESLSNRIIKRLFDIVFSLFVLIFIGIWLFPLLALLIKLNSKGPVFFSQMRSGKDGEAFKCYKFRSMTVNAEADAKQATRNDARVTSIGRILRKTSLDELPQFYNVLLGNMSVVGPRPHMLKHTESYRKVVHKFMVRHFAKPGITGWAQVTGYRGETKKVQDMANRAEADIWYIENWTLFLDIKIIFLTVWQMLFKRDENAF
ncbi:undecaprenyl-phosphate glucose phosphotransferase [Lutibacter sp. A64]|uniref:undecaprenyl-phosphate glucose phosphotransferase n=1 Tax=Lutibacter sp. A64 TaxID=2918526 RepID=UPI001F055475|nr:undecaprenyl-phosphate glucose phosphotransferase [Lutibacter sp. A64]UMB54368.1 undecaprenyl-phosphate glucose phosphotransferase [Lutibacter sp. A64]